MCKNFSIVSACMNLLVVIHILSHSYNISSFANPMLEELLHSHISHRKKGYAFIACLVLCVDPMIWVFCIQNAWGSWLVSRSLGFVSHMLLSLFWYWLDYGLEIRMTVCSGFTLWFSNGCTDSDMPKWGRKVFDRGIDQLSSHQHQGMVLHLWSNLKNTVLEKAFYWLHVLTKTKFHQSFQLLNCRLHLRFHPKQFALQFYWGCLKLQVWRIFKYFVMICNWFMRVLSDWSCPRWTYVVAFRWSKQMSSKIYWPRSSYAFYQCEQSPFKSFVANLCR
jgi:hypothetical protein